MGVGLRIGAMKNGPGWRYKAFAKDSMRYKKLGTLLWVLIVYIVPQDSVDHMCVAAAG